MLEPAHEMVLLVADNVVLLGADDVVLLGAEKVTSGLTPRLFSSEASSGMVPPFSEKFEFVPGGDRGDAVPLDDVAAQLDEVAAPLPVSPPPSDVVLTPAAVAPEPLPPDTSEDDDPVDEHSTGLRPPGSISVAPNGIPLTLVPSELGMPSGEVDLSPDGLNELCAWLTPQLNTIAAIVASVACIEISCFLRAVRLTGY